MAKKIRTVTEQHTREQWIVFAIEFVISWIAGILWLCGYLG